MAKKPTKKTSKKRQSKKLPLLRFRVPKTKTTAQKKKTAKKPRLWSLHIGPNLYLNIQLSRTKRKTIRSAKRHTKKQLRARRWRWASALAIITVGLAGIIYFGLNLWLAPDKPVAFFTPPTPQISNNNSTTTEGVLPESLIIPDISIVAPIVMVGQQADGAMEVPKRFDVGGWYKYSPLPGSVGPAVIVGHVDSKDGPAIFWRLKELKPGQFVYIKRTDGKSVKFRVASVRHFDQDKFPTNEVYGNIDYPGLRLITCGGWFDRSIGRYTQNTVVFATVVI
ncbi:MAG TPA: class F sortase [Candidatus Saccharimonadales bacterium]|nr:class F sortase [Candidatus Saccharimonadales bacterium]